MADRIRELEAEVERWKAREEELIHDEAVALDRAIAVEKERDEARKKDENSILYFGRQAEEQKVRAEAAEARLARVREFAEKKRRASSPIGPSELLALIDKPQEKS